MVAVAVPGGRALVAGFDPTALLTIPDAWGTAAFVVSLVGAAAALLARPRSPRTAAAVTTLIGAGWTLAGLPGPAAALPAALALYTVAVRAPLSTALVAAVSSSALLTGASLLVEGPEFIADDGPPVVVTSLFIALTTALGLLRRSRSALEASYAERLERAEQAQELEARRRVAEDRLRIARELHDVIAHHIAVISVQSAAADHLVGTDPGRAKESLGHVRRSAGTVLDELGTVLSVLRAGGAPTSPTDPDGVRPLAGMAQLVDGFRSTGVDVDLTHAFDADLAEEAELVAYRVVQEALTNVYKHAPGAHATVRISGDRALIVRVHNTAGPAIRTGPGGTGQGLTGMQERVARTGGSLLARPTDDGGFLVEATIPLSPAPSSESAPETATSGAHR